MSDQDCTPRTSYGPCSPYATLADVQACGSCGGMDLELNEDETPNAQRLLLEQALIWASRRVFEATGGEWWGCCTITVRPCRPIECSLPAASFAPPVGATPSLAWPNLPAIPFGTVDATGQPVFVNVWRCGCAAPSCTCGTIGDRLVLPFGPVREVLAVTIDGDVLDRDDHYAVTPQGELVRTDGETWPRCQDATKDDGAGTWSVTYRHGFDPPPELAPLVAAFACELAKSCSPEGCMLPAGFRVVQRDGVDFGVVEPAEYREQGLVGFGPLDDWIMLMRGGHVRYDEAPRAYIPRLPEFY